MSPPVRLLRRPRKEGKVRATNSIRQIWRGEPHPRNILLLDNDFFGQADWRDKVEELRDGDYKVAFSQGINVRMITEEAAAAIASVRYYDDGFRERRIYTAWDNVGQEKVFFKGLARLEAAGVPARHVMVFMLIGYADGETMEDILYRFNRLKDAGVMPYPMVFERWRRPDLARFQKWVVMRYYEVVPWEDFRRD